MLSRSSKSILFAAALGQIDHEAFMQMREKELRKNTESQITNQANPSLTVEDADSTHGSKLPPVDLTLGESGNSVIFLRKLLKDRRKENSLTH